MTKKLRILLIRYLATGRHTRTTALKRGRLYFLAAEMKIVNGLISGQLLGNLW